MVVLRKCPKFNIPLQYVPPYGLLTQDGEGEYVHACAVVQTNRDQPYILHPPLEAHFAQLKYLQREKPVDACAAPSLKGDRAGEPRCEVCTCA